MGSAVTGVDSSVLLCALIGGRSSHPAGGTGRDLDRWDSRAPLDAEARCSRQYDNTVSEHLNGGNEALARKPSRHRSRTSCHTAYP